jgi:anti-sigma regulatory factor (Ser/Thr protein kinase)
MPDQIALTLPADRDYHRVVHLVLGGLASRLNLTLETLEDLQLALDAVLEEVADGDEVTMTIALHGDALETRVGPVDVRAALDRGGDELGLRRVLDTVVDEVDVENGFVLLKKRVTPSG